MVFQLQIEIDDSTIQLLLLFINGSVMELTNHLLNVLLKIQYVIVKMLIIVKHT
jgi:hypothetical protein